MIFVAKFVFWNTITSAVLITLGNIPLLRFFTTYVLMGILFLTAFIKVIFGILYNIRYRCCCSQGNAKVSEKEILDDGRVEAYFKHIKGSLYLELRDTLEDMKKNCDRMNVSLGRILNIGLTSLHKVNRSTAIAHNKLKNMSRVNNSVIKTKAKSVVSVIEQPLGSIEEEISPKKKKFARKNTIIDLNNFRKLSVTESLRELKIDDSEEG